MTLSLLLVILEKGGVVNSVAQILAGPLTGSSVPSSGKSDITHSSSIEMMESATASHRQSDQVLEMLQNEQENSDDDRNRDSRFDFDEDINSPFHNRNRSDSRSRVISDNSAHSNDSAATIKWAEATDLRFKMVSNSSSVRVAATSGKWETVAAIRESDRSKTKSVSQIERLTNSFLDVFSVAKIAASSAVYGTYDEFGFTDFSTKQFATLRAMNGIDPDKYIESFKSTMNENFSEGRSGAFMFNSSDCRYFVKTTTGSEVQALLRILPNYINYLTKHPNSLLPRFLGAHCITMYSTKLYFLVMLNVFPRQKLSEKFDLKGSWVNRFGNLGGKQTRRERIKAFETVKSVPLYQDNDLQQKIALKGDVSARLMLQVESDTKFLAGRCQ